MVWSRAINISSHARGEQSDHVSALALDILVEPYELSLSSCTDPTLSSSFIFALDFSKTTFKSLRSLLQPRLLLRQNWRSLHETLLVHHCRLTPSPGGGTSLLHLRAKSTNKRVQLIQTALSPGLSSSPLQFPRASPVGPLPLAEGRWIVWKWSRDASMTRCISCVCMDIARKSREVLDTGCCVCKPLSRDCSSVSFWMCAADCEVYASMRERRSFVHDWRIEGLYSTPISLVFPSTSIQGIKLTQSIGISERFLFKW